MNQLHPPRPPRLPRDLWYPRISAEDVRAYLYIAVVVGLLLWTALQHG